MSAIKNMKPHEVVIEDTHTGFVPSPLAWSILGLVVLGVSGWMMRRQISSTAMPVIKKALSVSNTSCVKPVFSWLKESLDHAAGSNDRVSSIS